MFGSASYGANAYAKVGVETGVVAATPHQLIVMLFEGAMVSIANALQQMKAGNMSDKGQSISKAIAIIDNGLRASLDKKVGGKIAESLDSLYDYMSNRLLIANLQNKPEILEEVYRLLKELKEAWDGIAPKKSTAEYASDTPAQVAAHDPLAPHTSRLMKA